MRKVRKRVCQKSCTGNYPKLAPDRGCLLKRLNRGSIQKIQKTQTGDEFTDKFLVRAFYNAHLAALKSNDPSTQVGAVIIKDNFSVTGTNKFLPCIEETPEKMGNSTIKNLTITHAERNSIRNYIKLTGDEPVGLPLVASWAACASCAIDIIDYGISMVYTDYNFFVYAQSVRCAESAMRWEQSMHVALDMFQEAGVGFMAIDNLPDLAHLVPNKDISILCSKHDYYPYRRTH